MDLYRLLFWDSFKSLLMFSFSNETLWFVAKEFRLYNMLPVTLTCYAGAMLGLMANMGFGYLLTLTRGRIFTVDEELFAMLSRGFSKYGIYILLFHMLPFVKIFYFFAGLFAVPFKRLIMVALIGRAVFYLYYLYILPQIPSIVY